MDLAFGIKWLLSILVGGAWVTLTTFIAEQLGPQIGGLISGIPSTALITYIFIALTQSTRQAIQATTTVPLTVGFYSFFFIVYLLNSHRGFYKTLGISIAVWSVFAAISALINIQSFSASLICWITLISLSFWITHKKVILSPVKFAKLRYTPKILFQRAALSGIVISIGVLTAKILGPVWGGIFSTFPALTISTLLITYKSSGIEFTRHLMKNILLSITINLVLFAAFVRYGYQTFGMPVGTVVAYLGTLIATFLLHQVLKKVS